MLHGPVDRLESVDEDLCSSEAFLEIVDRMNRNMAPVMTVLMLGTMLSIVPLLLLLPYHQQPMVFYLSTAAFFVFFSLRCWSRWWCEVPIVQQIVTWTHSTLPENWR